MARKHARIFVFRYYLLLEANSSTGSEEQVMSKDKYASMFSKSTRGYCQSEYRKAVVFSTVSQAQTELRQKLVHATFYLRLQLNDVDISKSHLDLREEKLTHSLLQRNSCFFLSFIIWLFGNAELSLVAS